MVGLFSFFFVQKYFSQTQEGTWWDFFLLFSFCKNIFLKHKRGDGTWDLVLLLPKNIFFLQGFHCEWPSQLAASNRRWKVGHSVVSFCARERILINFFKIRCLSHTGPNCRQCEASNTLACKFLKKKVFTTLFKNALLWQIASSGTLLSGSTVSSKGVEIWQKVENNHTSFFVKKKVQDIPFHFQAGFWSTSSTFQPLVLASQEGGCSRQGTFSSRILCPMNYYTNYQNKHLSNIVMW